MRNTITCFLFLLSISCFSAGAQDTTSHFTIEGAIAAPVEVDWAVLKKYKMVALDSMPVYNHTMNPKGTLRNIKGVLLKDLLGKVVFNESSPKKLSEFYMVCTGADGYKVVFSWNEIFNTKTGNLVMIVMEKNGGSSVNQEDRMALISPADIATGRRYVKGLSKIIVRRAD